MFLVLFRLPFFSSSIFGFNDDNFIAFFLIHCLPIFFFLYGNGRSRSRVKVRTKEDESRFDSTRIAIRSKLNITSTRQDHTRL